ncbi:Gfo/Idh/MocA family protein [Acidicapsa dinghuensis]|uniref:Gfo/Idh/MocA family protein n=1 Tax=Acidicapsa dinghuensis TaxID=2218256 RepID=A0ABW1EGK1_9BACT|nr:Gfo/Idh/MocA family oxidoreductase [Acidicapsa dinghuensis]
MSADAYSPDVERPLTPSEASVSHSVGRRQFLHSAGGMLAAAGLSPLGVGQNLQDASNGQDYVSLPPIEDPKTEGEDKAPGPFESSDQRIGFTIVGIGHLTINQILPAFGRSEFCKPVALVSGSPDKALKIAAQYGVKPTSIYSYANFERLGQNPDVKVVYIVLPNSMHAEYTARAAKIGKHVLSEKPMATSVADCEKMIAACRSAKVKLMVAYRQQYEPMNREVLKMIRAGKVGTLRSFLATLTQNQGDPSQWRLHKALAGGGCLPDVGIYCLNAARFWSGEEPIEVFGQTFQPQDDPRFTEVEATCNFTLRFPSGLLASCNAGYAAHRSSFARMEGAEGWIQLSPSFGYSGLKLQYNRLLESHGTDFLPSINEKDQFALEMDHMAECVMRDRQPHTPGEEGAQDIRIIEAIYESARINRPVKLPQPPSPTRGPGLSES